jgi:hypothetical protein
MISLSTAEACGWQSIAGLFGVLLTNLMTPGDGAGFVPWPGRFKDVGGPSELGTSSSKELLQPSQE